MSKVKFLWVAALLALCVGLTAGGALAATVWSQVGTDGVPAAMTWDQSNATNVNHELYASNIGTTTWAVGYQAMSVDTPSGAPVVKIDRWGRAAVTQFNPGTIAPGSPGWFPLDSLVAPPISPMSYPTPVTATTAAVPGTMACKWVLADGAGSLFAVTPLGKDVRVGRFSDMLTSASDYCSAQVEQLAGLFPTKIVGGYPDGTYQPALPVDRATMAVFLQRALNLPTAPYQAYFSDVAVGHWASQQIEAMKAANLINGFPDGTYAPALIVDRGTMAVFIARAMYGSQAIPSGPSTASFPDVATSFWAFDEVEYCKANDVVGGYPDGTYGPALPVIRGTMALFIYRAFVQPNPSLVVLAGPGVTTVDPTTVAAGVSTVSTDPTLAYVAFDAVRMAAADLTVDFAVMNGATVVASGSDTIAAADIATAAASGAPHVYATFAISGVAAGSYTLVVSVGGDVMARQPAFTIAP